VVNPDMFSDEGNVGDAMRRTTLVALVVANLVVTGTDANAQERSQFLPLKHFINAQAASVGARAVSQRVWAKANCPKYFSISMWWSPLGEAFIEALRNLDPEKFKKSVADSEEDLKDALKDWATDNATESARKKYDFCKEVFDSFNAIESDASKAYWAADWQPKQ
jgi:hypothetical protein